MTTSGTFLFTLAISKELAADTRRLWQFIMRLAIKTVRLLRKTVLVMCSWPWASIGKQWRCSRALSKSAEGLAIEAGKPEPWAVKPGCTGGKGNWRKRSRRKRKLEPGTKRLASRPR